MADEFPSRSPIQFAHQADGSVRLAGDPAVTVHTVKGQASAQFPAWERTLGLPTFQEEWEDLAGASGLSARYLECVLCDESLTTLEPSWRNQPAQIRLQPARYHLTLGHSGFVIGAVYPVLLIPKDLSQTHRPDFVQGDCLVGRAQLYASPLADIAWRGVEQKIFSHACAVVNQRPEDPNGCGDLAEIALVSEPEAGCPGARVLRWWQA